MKPINDWLDHGVLHSERRERFCGHFVETGGDKYRAFRLAFHADTVTCAAQLQRTIDKLLDDAAIRARIKEMRDSAARACMITQEQILQDWFDVATADPNEIVAVKRYACRFCFGAGHRYQWATLEEWQRACVTASDRRQSTPDCSGGFGYSEQLEANHTCPSCYGEGNLKVRIADTTKLQGKARKLYKGAKQDRFGVITVEMHDQDQARQNLARAMGIFGKEGVQLGPVEQAAAPSVPLTAEQAREGYLRMVKR